MQSVVLEKFNGYLQGQGKSRYEISDLNWQVNQGQQWLLLGANGAGKSALCAALIGEAKLKSGKYKSTFNNMQLVSSDAQKQLIKDEIEHEQPTLVKELIFTTNATYNHALRMELIEVLNLSTLLNKHFRDLSTGETRKLLLINALSSNADLVVLDEPYDGLDKSSCETLTKVLAKLSTHINFVFVLNRLDEVPEFITHYGYVNEGKLQHALANPDNEQRADLFKLLHLTHTSLAIPQPENTPSQTEYIDSPLVKLTNANVAYGGVSIFKNLTWQINQYQHWQLSGKNGSGKTCLLNLITGDNPQCYNNDIQVFGFKRGSGESIWDIKQHIGFISNALHMDYRVSISALNTIISGFYDSIGLYQKPTDAQIMAAKQWLALIGLSEKQNTSFTQLSYGDQRMLLIVRAMIKHPTLLILDEPCLGLDEANRQRVLLLIEKVCAAKTSTVIYVNHHAADKIKGIENYLKMEDFH
ncbi:molybdate transport system ATP-binding protein [Pseudoalteromonas espejiana DSM 9414]|uniref:Molybdate ABC transporter ATP-binding protein ModF n=1 Tax=Pseudoalteromonas espejiana TaxID=28107 RepID=A0A510XQI1_9GAMM|nr:ATP-binding cassette domain-containing protein [Pseudoalteromonas espejiana]ASM48571.1 molybdate transport system ATP-binding protein [Pseudoalteromonas espejiana DSM 9414]GEK53288.1 molybdate ABC transporter ATP-binding protein ModF [Pseudoalteromonas espejiana]